MNQVVGYSSIGLRHVLVLIEVVPDRDEVKYMRQFVTVPNRSVWFRARVSFTVGLLYGRSEKTGGRTTPRRPSLEFRF